MGMGYKSDFLPAPICGPVVGSVVSCGLVGGLVALFPPSPVWPVVGFVGLCNQKPAQEQPKALEQPKASPGTTQK